MHDATETSVTDETGQQPTAATFPLLAHLIALLEELRARVPAALGEWEPEAIHQSRVATRRLKAGQFVFVVNLVIRGHHLRGWKRVFENMTHRRSGAFAHVQEIEWRGHAIVSQATRLTGKPRSRASPGA